MRDMEEEDIGRFFAAAAAFIEEARYSGGAALVHCHEGKSRSVTLVLAYFMQAMVRVAAASVQSCCGIGVPSVALSVHLSFRVRHTVMLGTQCSVIRCFLACKL